MKTKLLYSDKKKKIIKDYNSSSQHYDKRYQDIQEKKYSRVFEKAQIQTSTILDAGCGTGLLLEYISKKDLDDLSGYNYTGIDISINMLKIFKSKLKTLNKPLFVNLILADMEHLPFRDDIFDKIFSITVFQNLTDTETGFDNLIRVGKDKFEIFISILKKASTLEHFYAVVNKEIEKYHFENNYNLEDIFLWGTIFKKKNENSLSIKTL